MLWRLKDFWTLKSWSPVAVYTVYRSVGNSRTMEGVLCVEHYGSKASNISVIYTNDKTTGKIRTNKAHAAHSASVIQFLKTVFLPQGYPDSVSEDYFEYQIWDTMQAFCSSITGSLATQAVLKGSGVGDESANVASATITWLLKDGTGMVGRIAFAYFKGASLDCDAKRWRLFADVLNDCAIFIQLTAPIWPKAYFTPIMCLAGLAFSIVGVAGGCTRAALTMHQAKRDNMADVSAKDGSQETLVNLAGLVVNLFITPLVAGNMPLTWLLFVTFTFLHIFANYKAVSSVVMDTLNFSRLKVVVQHFYCQSGRVLTPKEANALEPVIRWQRGLRIRLGSPLGETALRSMDFTEALLHNPKAQYFLHFDDRKGVCYIALRDTASAEDVVQACCTAEISWIGKSSKHSLLHISTQEFMARLSGRGWNLRKHLLCADEWRWSTEHLDKIK